MITSVAAFALSLALATPVGDPAASGTEPSDPAPSDPAEAIPAERVPVELEAVPEKVPEKVPENERAPAPVERHVIEDPLAQCKTMLLDETELVANDPSERDARLHVVEKCFRDRAQSAAERKDHAGAARALAMADVVAAWRVSGAASGTTAPAATAAPTTTAPAAEQLSLTGLVESGRAEALLHGAAAGATGGFLLSGALFSTTRQNEQDTLPWLIAAPALGAVAGTAGAWALVEVTEPTTGDVAFASSAMWMGAAQGVMLELAVFDGSAEVSSIPLRFLTVFGGGTVGLAAGVALSPFLDVTQGDAAVANSAALWGGVAGAFAMSFAAAGGMQLNLGQASLLLSAGTTVPYIAVVAAHPYLTIERWPSWLIEAGGAGGFLVSGAVLAVLGSQGGLSGPTAVGLLGAGTFAGVVTGVGAAWAVSAQMASGTVVPEPRVAFAPQLFLDEAAVRHARGGIAAAAGPASAGGAGSARSAGGSVMPGFVVSGRF